MNNLGVVVDVGRDVSALHQIVQVGRATYFCDLAPTGEFGRDSDCIGWFAAG